MATSTTPAQAHAHAQRPYVVGAFEDHQHADQAIAALVAAGFSAKDIGFAMRDEKSRLTEGEKAEAYGEAALARTTTGAATGAILGGVLGALTSLLIPGFGAVLLSGMLVMAAGGGIAGGFAALISTMQLSDEEKHFYQHELHAGRCMVVVKADGRYSEALAILESNGARTITRQEARA